MKLGTLIAATSAALLMTAQPVMAEATRSASSLPSVSAPANVASVRGASRVGQSEDIVGVPFVILAIVGTIVTVLVAELILDIDLGLGIADS